MSEKSKPVLSEEGKAKTSEGEKSPVSESEATATGAMAALGQFEYAVHPQVYERQIRWRAHKAAITGLVESFAVASETMRGVGDLQELSAMEEVVYALAYRLEQKLGPYPS